MFTCCIEYCTNNECKPDLLDYLVKKQLIDYCTNLIYTFKWCDDNYNETIVNSHGELWIQICYTQKNVVVHTHGSVFFEIFKNNLGDSTHSAWSYVQFGEHWNSSRNHNCSLLRFQLLGLTNFYAGFRRPWQLWSRFEFKSFFETIYIAYEVFICITSFLTERHT